MKTDWQAYIGTKQSAHMDTIVNEIPRLTSAISYLMNMISNIATAVVEPRHCIFPVTAAVARRHHHRRGLLSDISQIHTAFARSGRGTDRKIHEFHRRNQDAAAGFKRDPQLRCRKIRRGRFDSAVRALMDNLVNATDNSTRPRMYSVIGEAVLICIIFFIAEVLLHVETANLIVVLYVFSRLWYFFRSCRENIQVIRESMPAYDLLNLGDEDRGAGMKNEAAEKRNRGQRKQKQDSGEKQRQRKQRTRQWR